MSRYIALFVLCLSWTACIPFDEDRDEFCVNVDPRLRDELCPSESRPDSGASVDASVPGDAGERPDAGAGEADAGPPGGCATAADCPTRTADCQDLRVCVDNRCEYRQQEDGAPCVGTPAAECRETTGTCRSGACQYTPRTTGPCDDGQPCTVDDVCQSGGVCAGTLLNCENPPRCMKFAGTCSNSQCNYVPAAAGTTCNDENACTENDACDGAGNCLSTLETLCPDQPNSCLFATGCLPSSGCTYTSMCRSFEICQNGGCCVPGVAQCEPQ
jgi:hypothetical protein